MSDALKGLVPPNDPNLLVGIETSDDAAVYRLTDEIAMISTVDFITPPVDDPYWFGQISALIQFLTSTRWAENLSQP